MLETSVDKIVREGSIKNFFFLKKASLEKSFLEEQSAGNIWKF
jgi:hypothetical protein